ncbi:carboxylesterase family protein [Pyrenochaeta sp. MPI-SDFR-AT-0127]|nr:carboxylesterase family protein [Pyrenochaeta sp. MPI-SDFR-AT-0127]
MLVPASSVSIPVNNLHSLPVVDLGYELYRAVDFNQTGGYYNFSNVRYAAPPVGDLRFRAPVPPESNRSAIQDGTTARICPNVRPTWMDAAGRYLYEYVTTGTFPAVKATNSSSSTTSVRVKDSRETEDCLFLDVIVPQSIFSRAAKGKRAPVLVWIHGGGYALGHKSNGANPRGLLERGMNSSSDGFVYVAINYRLGAFGFLPLPSRQDEGTMNAGFYDQRMALEWVQDNIHLFGGDKNRVTVIGESGGGGSIMHQITAYGGLACAPFQQAIAQSPGWLPYASAKRQEQTFLAFLEAANISSLAEARTLSSEKLMDANFAQIVNAPYGQYTYGPAVDGKFITEDAKELFSRGLFDKSVNFMAATNADEGILFTPPMENENAFLSFLRGYFPDSLPSAFNYMAHSLYPPVFDGSMGYMNNTGRASLAAGDIVINCNTYALKLADEKSYSYLFAVPPAIHAQDMGYLFYNADNPLGSDSFAFIGQKNETIAYALQDYVISFTIQGVPGSPVDALPGFPSYGENATVVSLASSSISLSKDPIANARCRWMLQHNRELLGGVE